VADAFSRLNVTTLSAFPCWESYTGSRGLLYLDSNLAQQATAFLLHTRMMISTEIFWIIVPHKYQPQPGERTCCFCILSTNLVLSWRPRELLPFN